MARSARKAVAILNPRAAAGKAGRRGSAVLRALERRLGSVRMLLTERPDHATELARRALEDGADLIIAVGGDGAINEVVNGFFVNDRAVRPGARLALIPIGTGGDFQRSVRVPADLDEAAAVIAEGRTLEIDVGKVSLIGHDGRPVVRHFVNLASFGMGGEVSVRAKNFLSRFSGKAAFLWATLRVFLAYRGKCVTLLLDDDPERREFTITNVAVGNGSYHGGGMHPCPLAVLDDGLLDVTVIEQLTMFELIRDLPVLYSDDVYRHEKVQRFLARKLVADSDEIVRVEVDGESLGRLPLEISLLEKALPLVVPPESDLLA